MITEIQRAVDALERMDPYERPSIEELYELGGALTDLLTHLRRAVHHGIKASVNDLYMAANVDAPADAPIRDDEGQHPQNRLYTARGEINYLDGYLDRADRATREFHSAISHISPRSTS